MTPEAMNGWTAGIIDGEGWVGWTKNGHGNGWCPVIEVSNTDEPICRLLQEYWGGRVSCLEKRKGRPNSKPIWVWRVTGKRCREFLNEVVTYLVGKKHQKAMDILNSR